MTVSEGLTVPPYPWRANVGRLRGLWKEAEAVGSSWACWWARCCSRGRRCPFLACPVLSFSPAGRSWPGPDSCCCSLEPPLQGPSAGQTRNCQWWQTVMEFFFKPAQQSIKLTGKPMSVSCLVRRFMIQASSCFTGTFAWKRRWDCYDFSNILRWWRSCGVNL